MRSFVIKGLVVLSSIIMFIGCAKEETPSISDGGSIMVTASVDNYTKAGYGSTSLPANFWMDIDQGEAKYNYTAVKMTKNGANNSYSAATTLLWAKEDHSDVFIRAISSGLPTATTVVGVSLDQSEESDATASDVLAAFSGNGVTVQANTINISFKHIMTKLEVSYLLGAGLESRQVVVKSMILDNVSVNGSYSFNANPGYSSQESGDVIMFHDASAKKAEAIFYPFVPSVNPQLVINATIDGTDCTFSCPVVPKDSKGFEGGKRYKMTVTMVATSVSGTAASIANGWDKDSNEKDLVAE